MKILILASCHPYKIAGVVALDIFKGLKEIKGNEVRLLVRIWDKYPDKDIIPLGSYYAYTNNIIIKMIRGVIRRVKSVIRRRIKIDPDYQLLDYDLTVTFFSTKIILKKAKFKPDVIIILFLEKFISYKNLYELNKQTNARIFLFPMDMAPFTGGCHYAWDCDGYTKQCGRCPALYSNDDKDQSFKNLKFNRDLIQKTNISLFACNSQIADQIRKSSIFKGKEVTDGIYPVPDEAIFYPRDKEIARDYFKIGKDKKVFLFGAYKLFHKRKGMAILIEALKIVSEKLNNKQYDTSKILLLVAGLNYDQIKDDFPFESRYIGFIQDYNELALAYSAADFYISPSLEDAGPTMVLQSLLCETPVISFNIGYAQEFIENGIDGFKAESKNAESLSNCLYRAISLNSENYLLLKSKLKNMVIKISKEDVIRRIVEYIKVK
jgi:glycosyltransferase involved in cell wall biosynthesis